MALNHKKVIVRDFQGGLAWGYLPQAGLLTESEVRLMEVDGRIKPIAFRDIKTIAFVRDFNLTDRQDPERLGRRAFATRPRGDGLWLKLVWLDWDAIEGLASFNTGFLDSLLEDHGVFLTPPDARSNTQRFFIPRPAIRSIEALGVIIAPGRRAATRRPVPDLSLEQPDLFSRSEEA